MAIYALGDRVPTIDPTAFVHPDAVLIGSVTIGAESSIWPAAVLRGDHGDITIGARTSIQDGTVIHTTPECPTKVGDDCVIGHLVHLEGCTIENFALVGSGSTVLHNAVVRSGSLVGAGALVPGGDGSADRCAGPGRTRQDPSRQCQAGDDQPGAGRLRVQCGLVQQGSSPDWLARRPQEGETRGLVAVGARLLGEQRCERPVQHRRGRNDKALRGRCAVKPTDE